MPDYNIRPERLPRLILADGATLEYWDLPSKPVKLDRSKLSDDAHLAEATRRARSWLSPPDVLRALDDIAHGRGAKSRSSRTYIDRGVRHAGGAIENLFVSGADPPLAASTR